MQLSPLQSRLAASMIASCLILVIYLLLFPPQFAFAAEFDPISTNHDAREWTYDEGDDVMETAEALDLRSPAYEPDFELFDRSIIGRVPDNVASLTNNRVEKSNIVPGVTMTYVFQASSVTSREAQDSGEPLELRRSLNESREPSVDGSEDEDLTPDLELERRQQPTKTLWISANTCEQPWPISPAQTTTAPPQLILYVSTSADNTSPGPGQDANSQKVIPFTEGAVMFNVSVNRDIYLSIAAPNVSTELFDTTRQFNFELVASTDRYYYSYSDQTNTELVWVDSDATAALLQTSYLTNKSDQVITELPYVMFAHNQDNVIINGIRNSYCGLKLYAQIRSLDDGSTGAITMGLKKGGDKNLTREQFYVTGLNASSNYLGILARAPGQIAQKRQDDTSSVGGGVVFQPTPFQTKPNGACTFVFNLTLCGETQYAVPGNLKKFPDGAALAPFYNNYTQTMWDNFDKVLQQVPCETSSTAQYSLARNCDDCKAAYKNWLCSVAVPRCEDFSAADREFLQIRNVGAQFPDGTFVDKSIRDELSKLQAFNTSRNPAIDQVVQPGPYKELLPCEDLCYELVRSCPASMGFSCPRPGSAFGFNASYGQKKEDGSLSCNYPGSAHFPSSASTLSTSWLGLAGIIGMIFMILL